MKTIEAIAWRNKFRREGLVLGGVFTALLLIGAYLVDYWILGIGTATGVFGFFFQRRMFRAWKSEKCGEPLHGEPKDGDKILFYCDACDIAWDTKVCKDGT